VRDYPVLESPGRADIGGLRLLESCSFRWIFDVARHRFLRRPIDATVWIEAPEAWAEYHRLEVDDTRSCFVVELNETRTRTLRAWLHTDTCRRCGRDGRSIGDFQHRIHWWKERLQALDPRFSKLDGRPAFRLFGAWARPEAAS
jgi:hypothetical protein